MGADVVVESTGLFLTHETAQLPNFKPADRRRVRFGQGLRQGARLQCCPLQPHVLARPDQRRASIDADSDARQRSALVGLQYLPLFYACVQHDCRQGFEQRAGRIRHSR